MSKLKLALTALAFFVVFSLRRSESPCLSSSITIILYRERYVLLVVIAVFVVVSSGIPARLRRDIKKIKNMTTTPTSRTTTGHLSESTTPHQTCCVSERSERLPTLSFYMSRLLVYYILHSCFLLHASSGHKKKLKRKARWRTARSALR